MLVVLARGPVATPLEAGLGEKFEAEVVVVYFVRKVPVAVAICLCRSGLDEERAIVTHLVIRVVERVDVDGQSAGMFRQVGAFGPNILPKFRSTLV